MSLYSLILLAFLPLAVFLILFSSGLLDALHNPGARGAVELTSGHSVATDALGVVAVRAGVADHQGLLAVTQTADDAHEVLRVIGQGDHDEDAPGRVFIPRGELDLDLVTFLGEVAIGLGAAGGALR